MPSPVGHALGGLAAGWLIAGAPASHADAALAAASGTRRAPTASPPPSTPFLPTSTVLWIATWRGAIAFASLGAAADLDLLVGYHRMYSHSLGAVALVVLAAMALTPASESRLLTGAACGAAYASHILLDWLGSDASPPIGIMALWPLSSDYYESHLHWFLSTERRFSHPSFWTLNLATLAREIGTLAPIAALVYALRRRKL
jgi:membrane-bound metal-dependent hydrolase YbcI (DUF457 family)